MSPAPARGSSVTVEQRDGCLDIYCTKHDSGHPVAVTVVAGDPGEANRITVTRSGDSWEFRDAGAPLRGCTPCPVTPGAEGTPGLSVNLGDQDDTLVLASGVATFIDGGAGTSSEGDVFAGFGTVVGGLAADVIRGSAGRDVLLGKAGDDRFYGGPGDDFFDDYGGGHNVYRGGPGRDWIEAKGHGRDRVDCGPGRDRLFADRRDIQRNCHP